MRSQGQIETPALTHHLGSFTLAFIMVGAVVAEAALVDLFQVAVEVMAWLGAQVAVGVEPLTYLSTQVLLFPVDAVAMAARGSSSLRAGDLCLTFHICRKTLFFLSMSLGTYHKQAVFRLGIGQ